MGFSAALCRGLIEARHVLAAECSSDQCFPRLYAAASLKLYVNGNFVPVVHAFSAALCRGLIEAPNPAEV